MRDDTNKKFWQLVAKPYTLFMKADKQIYEEICVNIRPHLMPDTKMIELATGPGILAFALANTGASIIATDYSEKMIAEAQKKHCPRNVIFEVANATSLPYKNESFDVVVMANALHIMPNPDQALCEIYRILAPGGLIVTPTFIQSESIGFKIRTWLMELVGFHTFYKWNAEQLANYIEVHGFEIGTKKSLGSNSMPLCYIEAYKQLTT